MDDFIRNFIYDTLNIRNIREYEFLEKYGFTFVIKREITIINDHLSSAEIMPVGMIYEENGEYCLAPLHGPCEIAEIVKEYVEKELK